MTALRPRRRLLALCALLALAPRAAGVIEAPRRNVSAAASRAACDYGDLSEEAAFGAAARACALHGDLILFNVNLEYAPLALRLVGNLRALRAGRNYLAVGYDAATCEALHRRGACCGHSTLLRGHAGVDAWQMGDGGGFEDRREKTILFLLKVQSILRALDAGVRRVLHLDLDMVLFSPPFRMFDAGGDFSAALLNDTLQLIFDKFDAATITPPRPCGVACRFPGLPDWDQVWEQFQLNALVAQRTPAQWRMACGAAEAGGVAGPYAWANLTHPGRNATSRLVALPEAAVGRLCALNATLAGDAPLALGNASARLLRTWPRPLVAGHLVFTPTLVRTLALRAAGWWRLPSGDAAPGNRSGAACFAQPGETALLLSQSGAAPPLLVLCTAMPREDGSPCCVQLEEPRAQWPWHVRGFTAVAAKRRAIRDHFPGCLDWDWEREAETDDDDTETTDDTDD